MLPPLDQNKSKEASNIADLDDLDDLLNGMGGT